VVLNRAVPMKVPLRIVVEPRAITLLVVEHSAHVAVTGSALGTVVLPNARPSMA
jgi:hypothetical protein